MKKILAFILAIGMIFSLAACGGEKAGQDGEVKQESNELDYANMSEDDLIKKFIKNQENITTDEFVNLVSTYSYATINDDLNLDENITDKAIRKLRDNKATFPKAEEYVETLLKSDSPQVRGYAFSQLSSFLSTSDSNLAMAKEALKGTGINVVTVIGFPLGANKTEVKAFEASCAKADGAHEIDMVINVTGMKNKDYDFVRDDIKAVKIACGNIPLKVILETDLLEKDEIKQACELAVQAGADFVKTSTGFVKNGTGAKAEDVKLMYETVNAHGLKVKASGGIRDKEAALDMVEAGASRLGTSSGVKIVS